MNLQCTSSNFVSNAVECFHLFFASSQVDSCWTNSKAIVLTPLTYVPGAKVDKYLGNLNFLLIRETSSLREIGGLSRYLGMLVLTKNAMV